MALIVLHVSQGGRSERALGSTVGSIPVGFWAALLSVELDDPPVLPFARVGSSQNSHVVGVCDACVQSQKGVRAGGVSGQHRRPRLQPAAGVGGCFPGRNALCPLGMERHCGAIMSVGAPRATDRTAL